MRKIFVTMASMILALVMCFSTLVGCGLVTTDTERDMNQVVATVQINDDATEDVIYKKDMVMAYLNYGYMYEQYYGYSREQTFTLIIDSLVNNRIFVQDAIAKGFTLDEEQETDALYNTYKAINDLLDSYKEQEDAEKADTLWGSVRTTPTNAANEEKELSKTDKEEYIAKGFDIDSSADVRTAFNKVIELLRVNELLGDDYKGDIKDTVYFKQTLKNYQETKLIEAVEAAKKKEIRDKFTFAELQKAYTEKYETQVALNATDFASKLSSATASDPLLVGFNGSYGYVYNLLLGADDILTTEISNIKTDNPNMTKVAIANARKAILEATTVIDQRSSWITSGYDLNYDESDPDNPILTFTGDYTFAEDTVNSLKFYGKVKEIKAANVKEDIKAKYKVTALKEFGLNEFIDEMETYLYGTTQTDSISALSTTLSDESKASIKKVVNYTAPVAEYANKINELLFAFSTDPGSLNTFKGYTIKPVPEGSDAEEYMQEFADGARELIKLGGNSYVMIATDYGYHVMFYSQIMNSNYNKATLEEYLESLYGSGKIWETEYANMLADWDDVEDTENYLYLLANSLFSTEVSNAITKYQRDTLNTYRYNGDAVTLYKDRYADLLA